jgi:predicted Zn-dependent peptidase
MGYKVPGNWGPETYVLAVLARILSGDATGRLDQALTDQGITSDTTASLITLKDSGMFQLVGYLSSSLAIFR